jgi:hypothetical protein
MPTQSDVKIRQRHVQHNTRTCTVPGRKPGTSTKVTMGMLKASRKRTKRAALMDESMSRQPARCEGLLATTWGS